MTTQLFSQKLMLLFGKLRRLRLLHLGLAIAALMSPAAAQAAPLTVYAINSGGNAVSPFTADANFSGGTAGSVGDAIDTTGVSNPAPQAVYQSERWGNNTTYTFPNLFATHNYTVRLHFAETYFANNTAGKRVFNVAINGATVLSNFDIFVAAGGQYKAVVREFQVAANASAQIVVQLQNGAADNAKISGIEIIDPDYVPPPFCLNVDIDHNSSTGNVHSGVGAAPDLGTTWNGLVLNTAPNTSPKNFPNLVNSRNVATTTSVSIASSGGSFSSFSRTGTGFGNENPVNLMKDYLFNNTYTVTVSGLAQKNYFLYVYAHGDAANQASTVTVPGGVLYGNASKVAGSTGTEYRNIFSTNPPALDYSYLRFPVSVGAAGTLSFTAASWLNGFQILEFPKPTITTQPPASPSVTLGSSINIPVVATGEGTLTYQWRKGGVNLTNGATGNGSTISGTTSATLVLSNAQNADAGDYDVVITNEGGSVTSNVSALSVTSTALPPSIDTHPSNQTVRSDDPNPALRTATFTVTANGTAPLAYQWRKGGTPLNNGATPHGSTISGADTATLTISNAKIPDAGSYTVVVTNAPATNGSATSNAATLTVNEAPGLGNNGVPAYGSQTTADSRGLVQPGSSQTLSVTATGSPAPTYQWQRTIDGLNFTNVAGGTNANLTQTITASNSGFYRVTVTNSVSSTSSALVYLGVASTALGSTPVLAPSNNATAVNRDTPLSMTFSAPPIVGSAGAVRIYDTLNEQDPIAVIDLSQITVISLTANNTSYGVYHYKTRVIQGDNYYTQPIVAIGSQPTPNRLPAGSPTGNPNQVLINLPTSKTLTYGKTYYVKLDPGVLVDSTGATYEGITDATKWRFTVKADPYGSARPGTLDVGNPKYDGSPGDLTDFSTIQGAVDFVKDYNPQPTANSRVTITVRNGIYYEIVVVNSSYVTIRGQSQTGTIVAYLVSNTSMNAPGSPQPGNARFRAVFRITDASQHNLVQNLTIYNLTPQGGSQAEAFLPGGQFGIASHVSAYSYQDTMLLGNNFFMTDSYVEGAVDFIWGGSFSYFQRCLLRANANNGTQYTQARNTQSAKGYAFVDCTLDAYPNVTSGCFLSRTFTDFSQTIFVNCKMGPHISPQGWSISGANTATVQLWEYQSKDLNGNPLDVSGRPTYNRNFRVSGNSVVYDPASAPSPDVLPNQQASANLAALFSTPQAFFGGTWTPMVGPTISTQPQPVSQTKNSGESVSFSAAAVGEPLPTYQWRLNGNPISGATSATYTINSVTGAHAGDYTVVATNSSGSVTSNAATLIVHTPAVSTARSSSGGTKVSVASLLANAGLSSGTVTVTSPSPNGATVTVGEDGWIYYTPASGFTGPDSFNYSINGGQVTGTVNVTIAPDVAVSATITNVEVNNGTVRIVFAGIPGRAYRMEFTQDLASPNWQTASGTLTETSDGIFEYTEPSPSTPTGFYRVAYP